MTFRWLLAVLAATEQISTPAGNAAGQISTPLGMKQGRAALRSGMKQGRAAPAFESTVLVWENWLLDGTVRPVRGALSMACTHGDCGFKARIFPMESAREASVVEGIDVLRSFIWRRYWSGGGFGGVLPSALIRHRLHRKPPRPLLEPPRLRLDPLSVGNHLGFWEPSRHGLDPLLFGREPSRREPSRHGLSRWRIIRISAQVRGQAQARRALEVAAAGGHNVLMTGPPVPEKHSWHAVCQDFAASLPVKKLIENHAFGLWPEFPGQKWGWWSIRRPFRPLHHTASVISWLYRRRFFGNARWNISGTQWSFVSWRTAWISGRAGSASTAAGKTGPYSYPGVTKYHIRLVSRWWRPRIPVVHAGFRGHPVKNVSVLNTRYNATKSYFRTFADRIDIHLQVKPVEVDDMIPEQPHPLFSGIIRALPSLRGLRDHPELCRVSRRPFAGSSGVLPSLRSFRPSGSSGSSDRIIRSSCRIIRGDPSKSWKARQILRERFCNSCGIHTNAHNESGPIIRHCQLNPVCRSFSDKLL